MYILPYLEHGKAVVASRRISSETWYGPCKSYLHPDQFVEHPVTTCSQAVSFPGNQKYINLSSYHHESCIHLLPTDCAV